jgi:hypothetical protein
VRGSVGAGWGLGQVDPHARVDYVGIRAAADPVAGLRGTGAVRPRGRVAPTRLREEHEERFRSRVATYSPLCDFRQEADLDAIAVQRRVDERAVLRAERVPEQRGAGLPCGLQRGFDAERGRKEPVERAARVPLGCVHASQPLNRVACSNPRASPKDAPLGKLIERISRSRPLSSRLQGAWRRERRASMLWGGRTLYT